MKEINIPCSERDFREKLYILMYNWEEENNIEVSRQERKILVQEIIELIYLDTVD